MAMMRARRFAAPAVSSEDFAALARTNAVARSAPTIMAVTAG
jgi:hypothetical protein